LVPQLWIHPLTISAGVTTCVTTLIITCIIDGVSAKFDPPRMEPSSLVVVDNYSSYHSVVLDAVVLMNEIKIGLEILIVCALVYGSTSTWSKGAYLKYGDAT
jgi:hypothetical protein